MIIYSRCDFAEFEADTRGETLEMAVGQQRDPVASDLHGSAQTDQRVNITRAAKCHEQDIHGQYL